MRNPASGGLVVVVFAHGEPTMVFLPGDGRSVGELLLAAGVIDEPTLAMLVQERPASGSSLEDLVRERTSLTRSEVQRFLDFQARMRMLDALVWEEGFFELEEYRGGGEVSFSLHLPTLTSLLVRARARVEALPRLIDRLPASPGNTLVRRRRGGATTVGCPPGRSLRGPGAARCSSLSSSLGCWSTTISFSTAVLRHGPGQGAGGAAAGRPRAHAERGIGRPALRGVAPRRHREGARRRGRTGRRGALGRPGVRRARGRRRTSCRSSAESPAS